VALRGVEERSVALRGAAMRREEMRCAHTNIRRLDLREDVALRSGAPRRDAVRGAA
jgi:hypothetical protein